MTEQIKLSKRLIKVASFIPRGAHFADIGSDHAYLPCYICSQDPTARGIAGEVNEGPFLSAKKTVTKYGLHHVIDVRLGNGLSVLRDNEVEQVVIAGMGGSLIRTILEEGIRKLRKVNRIIAQPNIDEKNVRKWFVDNGYVIVDEVILQENGHIYEIIVARKTSNPIKLSPKEIYLGPNLLRERHPLFIKKWQSEKLNLHRVISQMKKANEPDWERINEFKEQYDWIEEVLSDV